jgi:hypothetical protein
MSAFLPQVQCASPCLFIEDFWFSPQSLQTKSEYDDNRHNTDPSYLLHCKQKETQIQNQICTILGILESRALNPNPKPKSASRNLAYTRAPSQTDLRHKNCRKFDHQH